jgi:hypothetical protein
LDVVEPTRPRFAGEVALENVGIRVEEELKAVSPVGRDVLTQGREDRRWRCRWIRGSGLRRGVWRSGRTTGNGTDGWHGWRGEGHQRNSSETGGIYELKENVDEGADGGIFRDSGSARELQLFHDFRGEVTLDEQAGVLLDIGC